MKKVNINILSKIGMVAFIAMIILLIGLLFFVGIRENVKVRSDRIDEGFVKIEGVRKQLVDRPGTPLGQVTEYVFKLGESLGHDATLAFISFHNHIDIYLDGNIVYSMRPSGELDMIKTTGSNCVMIPLYEDDAGKEARVVLTPVYESYKAKNINFYQGSSMAIYKNFLRGSIGEIIISFSVILVGAVYILIAIYYLITKQSAGNFVSLGMLALSMGLWRVTDTNFSPFIVETKPVLMFYISVIMLLFLIIPLIKAAGIMAKKEKVIIADCAAMVVSLVGIVQLMSQITGTKDMREMLTVTHVMLLLSAAYIVISMIIEKIKSLRHGVKREMGNTIWIIAAGMIADLVSFYIRGTSSGLLFTLITTLIYVLIEGVRSYMSQKQLLIEKDVQLVQSRALTMMSQIRSHFVFNILNAISGMCKYDPEKADETIVCFARYLRSNINIMQDDSLITFQTDLRHVEDYVALEQIRFGDRINFITDISVDQFLIPPLLIQPIIENSIKYGLTPKISGGTIKLSTRAEGKSIKIIIQDNGVGFNIKELEKKGSVGLKNIEYRLEHMMQGTLDISSEIGKGTVVTISIPRKEI